MVDVLARPLKEIFEPAVSGSVRNRRQARIKISFVGPQRVTYLMSRLLIIQSFIRLSGEGGLEVRCDGAGPPLPLDIHAGRPCRHGRDHPAGALPLRRPRPHRPRDLRHRHRPRQPPHEEGAERGRQEEDPPQLLRKTVEIIVETLTRTSKKKTNNRTLEMRKRKRKEKEERASLPTGHVPQHAHGHDRKIHVE